MQVPLILRWGDHCLRIVGSSVLRGTLMLRKKHKHQNIPVDLGGMSREEIERAWGRQEQKWIVWFVQEGDLFLAIRVIDVSPNKRIVWFVDHAYDVPADICTVWSGDYSKEEIIAAYVDVSTAA